MAAAAIVAGFICAPRTRLNGKAAGAPNFSFAEPPAAGAIERFMGMFGPRAGVEFWVCCASQVGVDALGGC